MIIGTFWFDIYKKELVFSWEFTDWTFYTSAIIQANTPPSAIWNSVLYQYQSFRYMHFNLIYMYCQIRKLTFPNNQQINLTEAVDMLCTNTPPPISTQTNQTSVVSSSILPSNLLTFWQVGLTMKLLKTGWYGRILRRKKPWTFPWLYLLVCDLKTQSYGNISPEGRCNVLV